MPPRRLICAITAVAALAAPAAAHAGVFPGEVVDGPSADLVRMGDVDVARDGTGAVVYVKQDGGTNHVFVSRLADGAWQPPERVDAGLGDAGSQPAVAASTGGRLAIAFVSGTNLYSVVRPAGQGMLPPQLLGSNASSPAVDMSINGAAYITYTAGGDVRAARLDRTSTAFTELGAVLDVNPGQPAGDTPTRQSDVAVSADGTGLAVWGERGDDGRDHVYARRLYNASLSTAPQDLTLSDFQGHSGGSADAPDVDIEDDSSYAWVAYRQVLDGTPRAVARRLVGSVFDAPVIVDPFSFPASEGVDPPAIEMNGTGGGIVTVSSSNTHQVYTALLADDEFAKGAFRIDGSPGNATPARPLTGVAQGGNGFVSWLQSDPGLGLHVRVYDIKTGFEPDTAASKPDFGPVDPSLGYDGSADRVNDAAVVAMQGSGSDRRLVAAMIDRPPGKPVGTTTQKVRRFKGLSWQPAFELWGTPTYTVQLDGKPIGQTQATKYGDPVPDGVHRWRVIATDRRGQTSASATRTLRVDNTAPTLIVRISGTRKAGKLLKFRFSTGDVVRPGASGLSRIRVVWGDGSRAALTGKNAAHRFRRGKFTVRVSSTDKAGNVTVVSKRLTIKKK